MSSTMPLMPRRTFLAAATASGLASLAVFPHASAQPKDEAGENILGPKPGYSPQIGTLVSMLLWMRPAVTRPVKGLTQADLDWLFDANANSIGALLLHLAATETYYGLHTFDGIPWDGWSEEIKKKWDPAMGLGDAGRQTIKGHDLDFYLSALRESREHTLTELRKRDDAWLLTVDQKWPWGPTNNYCKWFHVCEHESHHAGQIDMLLKRLPSHRQRKES